MTPTTAPSVKGKNLLAPHMSSRNGFFFSPLAAYYYPLRQPAQLRTSTLPRIYLQLPYDSYFTRQIKFTMGNDGGSIPTRRELVKSSAAALSTTQVKEIQTEQQEHYWSTCALSYQPLRLPVVSDALGTLYNKDALIDHLLTVGKDSGELEKGELEKRGEAFKDRLRGLRDVVEVRFQTEGAGGSQRWICPVTGKVLGPGTRAAYLVPCGHAFAESVFKEMPGNVCLQVRSVYRATTYTRKLMTCSATSSIPLRTSYPSSPSPKPTKIALNSASQR